MAERIVIGTTVFNCPEQPEAPVAPMNNPSREWLQICIIGTVEAAKAAFVNGIPYSQEWDSTVFGADGVQTGTEVISKDLTEYSVAGDIVDHRNGHVTVYMGKKTEKELLEEENAALLFQVLTGEVL